MDAVAAVVAVSASVSVVCDQVNQVVPAYWADGIDAAHQADPVHQLNEIDEVHQVHQVKNTHNKE